MLGACREKGYRDSVCQRPLSPFYDDQRCAGCGVGGLGCGAGFGVGSACSTLIDWWRGDSIAALHLEPVALYTALMTTLCGLHCKMLTEQVVGFVPIVINVI